MQELGLRMGKGLKLLAGVVQAEPIRFEALLRPTGVRKNSDFFPSNRYGVRLGLQGRPSGGLGRGQSPNGPNATKAPP